MGYTALLHRRCYGRFSVNSGASIIIDRNLEQPAILKDLSARGAGVVSNYPLNVNAQVEIIIRPCFFLKEPSRRKAKVAWCHKINENLWQAGLDFGLDQLIKLC